MDKKEEKGIFSKIYNWFKNLTTRGLLLGILLTFIIIIILLSASYIPSILGRVSSSLTAALYSIFVPAENTQDNTVINENYNSNQNISTTTSNTSKVTNTPPKISPVINLGPADLAVTLLQVGLLNGGPNLVTNQNQFYAQDMAGIKFQVKNIGGVSTGQWFFTASLPSLSTPIYNSPLQISLLPGESIIFTLGFSNLTNQNNSLITINVDPQNSVRENIEYNNIVTTTITNLGYNNNYYNYNGYNNYYGYNNLRVTCYGEPSDPSTGDRVRWYVDVFGGDGDYNYDWTGTNNLNSSSKNPSKTYSTRGTKKATVTVTDGDDNEATDTCSVYVD